MPNKNLQRRNEKIRETIRTYKKMGYKIKDAIKLTAEKFFLSETRIRDIIYKKELTLIFVVFLVSKVIILPGG